MKNIKTQGFVLIDVDVVALNNAGKNTQSNYDNAVATKTIRKNGLIAAQLRRNSRHDSVPHVVMRPDACLM